jgi:hypothetical protein
MRKSILCIRSNIVRGSALVVLLLTLFTMMSVTTFAHDLNGQRSRASSAGKGTPSGVADLEWNPQTQALTATVHLSGLQPESSYANHIHAGDCSVEGKMLYPFNNVVTDAAGNGIATTTINNITDGIPASSWSITVHRGATAEAGRLLCGNVVNPKGVTSVTVLLSLVDPID